MDKYIAIRDCYFKGNFLKKGQFCMVAKGKKVDFKLVKKVEEEPKKDAKK